MTIEIESATTYEIRDVPGYPGYKADTDGKVFSPSGNEVGYRNKREEYYRVALPGGHKKLRHVLVCLAFHGLPPSILHDVAHWNDVPGDDRPANLRWATPLENAADSIRNGKRKVRYGQHHANAKLTDRDVVK